ncbi:hypothetical protein FRB95_005535 [Tulasnella sp. JGI-2019a]|nr:hypothetical protein FRB95_005535 [Tulasnella sp. JGI-2019a]
MDPPSKTTHVTDIALTVTTSPVYDCAPQTNESDKLPVELLVKIFGYVSGLCGSSHMDLSQGPYVPKLHNLGQVCRRWLEIVKGTPKLWAFVTDLDPVNVALALDRSQSHPLGVAFAHMPLRRPLYATVLNHSQRWIRLDIQVSPREVEILHGLEKVCAPVLQHLRLELSTSNKNTTIILDLFRDHPPRLTSLALVGIAMHNWNSPIFGPHLHSLQLERIHTSGPTREDLRSILHTCPELAHLELAYVVFSDGSGGFPPLGPRVQLPLLHSLLLRPVSSADAMDIARMAETPCCKNYLVSRGIESPDSIVFSAIVLQIQPLFEAYIASGCSLQVHLIGSWIRIRCRDGQSSSSSFILRFGKVGSCEKVLGWLNKILLVRRPPLSPIPVDVQLNYTARWGSSSPSTDDLLRLSNVRSLTITDTYGCTVRLLNALSIPTPPSDGCDRWLWPSLRKVNVSAFRGPSTVLLNMIKTRAEAALRRKKTGGMDGIVMLKKLEVGEDVFTFEEFEAVRAVLGNAAVMRHIDN